jgi:hypothetical protein
VSRDADPFASDAAVAALVARLTAGLRRDGYPRLWLIGPGAVPGVARNGTRGRGSYRDRWPGAQREAASDPLGVEQCKLPYR